MDRRRCRSGRRRAVAGPVDAGDEAELADRFSGPLTFGTAGLRGPLRAGPNGMNRTVVRRAAAGLAAWLTDQGSAGRPVVVGFDARHGSTDFARDSAEIFAAAGFDARLMPAPLPTPITAFAVQRFGRRGRRDGHRVAQPARRTTATRSTPPTARRSCRRPTARSRRPSAPSDRRRAIPLTRRVSPSSTTRSSLTTCLGRGTCRTRPARRCRSSTPRCTVSARRSRNGYWPPPGSRRWSRCPSRNVPTRTSRPWRSPTPKSPVRSTCPSTSPRRSAPIS